MHFEVLRCSELAHMIGVVGEVGHHKPLEAEFISHEVRATNLIITDSEECSKDSKDYTKEWDVEGEKVIISIKN